MYRKFHIFAVLFLQRSAGAMDEKKCTGSFFLNMDFEKKVKLSGYS